MVTFSISFDDDVVERWSALAAAQGVDLDKKFAEAIIDRMEEMEDYEALKARLSKPYKTIPHEEVWRSLGLEDAEDDKD